MAYLDPYQGPWTEREAAHLARRAGFGATVEEITSLTDIGLNAAVEHYIDYQSLELTIDARIQSLPNTSDGKNLKNPVNDASLQGWWLYRMVHTTQPLQEQLTLCLHNLLVSSYPKVNTGVTNRVNDGNDGSEKGQKCNVGTKGLPPDKKRKAAITTRMLQDQNKLYRETGNKHYRNLLKEVTRDPAMLIYLDNRLNKKGKAQENYAREVLELFSMGEGNYSEQDVREIARAFTGETINTACQDNWPYTYFFNSNWHDTGSKTVFGQKFNKSGTKDTDYVIDLIMEHVSGATDISAAHAHIPATALYISWKLLTWFVNDTITIEHPVVAELADLFQSRSIQRDTYHVGETLRTLFNSQFFYDETNHYNMIKRPADFMTMALRTLDLEETAYTNQARKALEAMGMRLFAPPTVAGWNHGTAWINSGYLLARYNYADRLSDNGIATNTWVDSLITDGHVQNYQDHEGLVEFYRTRLIQAPLSQEELNLLNDFLRQIDSGATSTLSHFRRKVRGLIHVMMSLPRYQLK